ncbi:YybH family protein [Ferruginibacter sp.]
MYKLLPVILLVFLFSCNLFPKKKIITGPDEKQKMMDTDRAFSKLSVEKGMKNAFLEYIDSNGVLLKPNRYPILGAEAIDYLIQQNDSAYTLQWEPEAGFIAQSGELGYTYGVYAFKPNGKDTATYGTYVSIWKKQADGKWKFVLDSGNEGVGEEE